VNYSCDVDFGGVSIGDESGRLGVKISRDDMTLEMADELFAGRRLTGEITLAELGDENQERLPGMEDERPPMIESVFDVKRYSAARKQFTVGFTFALSEIFVQDLARFAKRRGRIVINEIDDLEEGGRGGSDDFDDDDFDVRNNADRPHGTPALEAAARIHQKAVSDEAGKKPLSVLVTAELRQAVGDRDIVGLTNAKAAKLIECVGPTVDDLEKVMRENEYWHRDVKGFGEEWITRVVDSLLAYRKAFPVPGESAGDDGSDDEAGTVFDGE